MKLNNITKVYHNKNREVTALENITIELAETGLIVLLGPSGCGKTTLLNILAKEDTQYQGEIIDAPNTIYLTQDVHLLEALTVEDNLLLVNSNKEVIQEYLKKYGLYEHRNKKVKKCSSGQKKRVQFLRALLVKPGLLLCDEPTAALDHENAELLMNDLKEISKSMQVLLVTHDIALAEKYADRIIRMDKGRVKEDQIISQGNQSEEGEKVPSKSGSQTLIVAIKNSISNPLQTLLFFMLAMCMVSIVYISVNLYKTTESATEINNAFKKGENLILSMPHESGKRTQEDGTYYATVYRKYDYYFYNDIKRLIEENQEIIAVEAFTSEQFIWFGREYSDFNWDAVGYKRFNVNGVTKVDGSLLEWGNLPIDLPFLLMKNLEEIHDTFDYYFELIENRLSIFNLVNGYNDLPLLCGSMPTKVDEIIIDRNVGEMLLKHHQVNELKDLIGLTIPIGLQTRKNLYSDKRDNYAFDPLEVIYVTISGVSSLQNDNMNMAFFNQGIENNPILNHVVEDYDKVWFHYVRFFVDPNSNVSKIVDNLNESLPQQNNSFIRYDGKGIGEDIAYYRSPVQFFTYSIGSVVAVGGLFIVLHFFIQKKLKKEARILKEYGYSTFKERGLRLTILYGIVGISSFILFIPIVEKINSMAQKMYYAGFMNYDPIWIVLTILIVMIFHFMIETLFSYRRK